MKPYGHQHMYWGESSTKGLADGPVKRGRRRDNHRRRRRIEKLSLRREE